MSALVSTAAPAPAASASGRGPAKGWCPGVVDPMQTGDGWLLRVRLPGGSLSADDLRAVAAVARQFGSGFVDLTSRANVQVRGVAGHDVDRASRLLVAAGLAQPAASVDSRRAVVASPLAGHDSEARVDATPVVTAVVDRLVADLDGAVPSKFGVVVDDGGSWSLAGVDGDIAFEAVSTGWIVRVRGVAAPVGLAITPADVADTALAGARLCVAGAARLDRVVGEIGIDRVVAALGLAPVPPDARRVRSGVVGRSRMLGLSRHREVGRCNLVAAPFLGRLDADMLIEIADAAERARAAIRITPDHSIALCSIAADAAPALVASLVGLGLVVDTDDPRANVSACVGSRGCASAHADTWVVAHALSAQPSGGRTHLSACAKCCGAPPDSAGLVHLVADTSGVFR